MKKEGKVGGSIPIFAAIVNAKNAEEAEIEFKKKIFLSASLTKRYIDEKDLTIEIRDLNDDM